MLKKYHPVLLNLGTIVFIKTGVIDAAASVVMNMKMVFEAIKPVLEITLLIVSIAYTIKKWRGK